MKKLLFLFLAVLSMGVTASAQDSERIQCFEDGDWFYSINPDEEHAVTVQMYYPDGGNFSENDITELTIPSYCSYKGSRYFVTALGNELFCEMNNEGNEEYTHYWEHGTYTNLQKVTIPNTVTKIGILAFSGCSSLTSITIPESVTEIGSSAFYECSSLTSITIPESVTEIGPSVFSGCSSLTSITLPNSVTEIDEYVFYGCSSLPSITIPESVTVIGGNAFSKCSSLTSVTLPNSVTVIGRYAFYGCSSLTSVTLPNSLTEIGGYAFYGCSSLTSITIPESVTEIGSNAFSKCSSLTSITIPASVTEIFSGSFSWCENLEEILVAEGNPNYISENGVLYNIDKTTLIQCPGAKAEVNIAASVTKIGYDAFYGCSRLTSVTIPASVTEIRSYAFESCKNLKTIYALPTTPPTTGDDVFAGVPTDAVVYIPKGTFKAYFVADGWSYFTDFREMGALDIELSETTLTLKEGETATVTAKITKDDDVTIDSESWTSSNPEIATVDDNGVVTAVAQGTATITFTVVDLYGVRHSESCEVVVTADSGINGIEADGSDAPVEYFNLNGVRVNADALTPGLYIKRQGNKTEKVIVR